MCIYHIPLDMHEVIIMEFYNVFQIFQGEKKHSTVCKYGSHDPVEELNSFFSLAIPMDSDERLINIVSVISLRLLHC